MSKKKVLSILLLLIILALGVWYLFIKNYNYKITFKTSQSPGAIYASLAEWQNLRAVASDSMTLESKNPFDAVSHLLSINDSSFLFQWEIQKYKSGSKVIAYVKDKDNSLAQNLLVPFKKNAFVNRSIEEVKQYMEYVKYLEDGFNISIEDNKIETIPSTFYAYIPLKSKINEKANQMANNIGVIMGYIRSNDIQLNGDPFIIVNNLDLENNMIDYEFCFPIKKSSNYPPSNIVNFKEREEMEAIKANFNGNYRSTEFAWFDLMDYAKKNGIDIQNKAIEIYKNDPQSGTDSKDWVAEVYIPIK